MQAHKLEKASYALCWYEMKMKYLSLAHNCICALFMHYIFRTMSAGHFLYISQNFLRLRPICYNIDRPYIVLMNARRTKLRKFNFINMFQG